MAGISSVELYNFVVNVLANKSQDGGITISQYNQAQYAASLQLWEQYIGELQDFKPNSPISSVAYAKTNKVESDINPFRVPMADVESNANGVISFTPLTNLGYVTDLYGIGGESDTIYPCVRINEQRIATQLSSRIAPPTTEHPFYFVNNESIQVFPKAVADFKITYIKRPENRVVRYTLSGSGRPIISPVGPGGSDSQFLEWNQQNFNDLSVLILAFLGVNLKDSELIQFSQLKQQGR